MKHHAGLDLSMESTQVCLVDENGRKLLSEKVVSSPEAISMILERYGPIERAVIETGRMSPAICLGLRELGVPVVCIDARQAHQSLKAMKATRLTLTMRPGSHSWHLPAVRGRVILRKSGL